MLLFARDSPLSRDVIAAAEQRFKKNPSTIFFTFPFVTVRFFFLSFLSFD